MTATTSTTSDGNGNDVLSLCELVLSYLGSRPNSMDTLDGIANWWIDEPGGVDRRRLLKALERLVDLGVLAKVRTAGQQFFRLAAPLAALVERGIIEAGMGGELLTYRLASRPTTEDGSDMDDRTPTAE